MKRNIFLFTISLLISFLQIAKAQNSVLNEGYYFPMNGSYPSNYAVDDECTSYQTAPNYQPCNRGFTDEAGVANGAYFFRNATGGFTSSFRPLPGNYFPNVTSTGITDYSNGLTIAFSYKLTNEGRGGYNIDPSSMGGTVISTNFSVGGINGAPSYPRGFDVRVSNYDVTFRCAFGWYGGGEGGYTSVTTNGVQGLISPFVPDTGVWYHVVCKVEQDQTQSGGYTRLSIFINDSLKGINTILYQPDLWGSSISLGAAVRPNNANNRPTWADWTLYNPSNPYHPFNNNPHLISDAFNGTLDEVRIYNRAINPSEATEVYNARLNSPVPAIRSYSPTSVKAGANMTIIGNNFTDASSVQINGTAADSLTIISDDTIRAKVSNPTGSTDSTIIVRSVRVINDDGNAVRYGVLSSSTTTTPAPPRPGIIISGPASACGLAGTESIATYRVTDTLPTTYVWRVSTSNMIVIGGLTADTLRVKFKSTFTSGVIYVKRMRVGDTTNLTLVVTNTTPVKPSVITGNKNICNNVGTGAGTPSRYFVRRATGAAEYVWTLPTGASVQGVSSTGSTYITPDTAINLVFTSGFTSGTLSVRSQNQCGSSADVSILLAPVNVAIPGAITGATDVCASMISDSLPSGLPVTYKVRRNAAYAGYTWTVPAHVNIIDYPGGYGTNNDTAITVIFDSTFVSGNISVQGVTPCFTTAPRNLAVTRRLPSYRLISILSSSLTCPTRSIQYKLTFPIQYARWHEWSLPTNASIDGRSDTTQINAIFTTAASQTGDRVRVRGINNCGKGIWTALTVKLPACSTSFAKGLVKEITPNVNLKATAYPNPSNSSFNLQWSNNFELPVNIQVTDIVGKRIEQWQAKGLNNLHFGQNYKPGIYMVQLKQGSESQILRVVKY
jgi:hypothetical protein